MKTLKNISIKNFREWIIENEVFCTDNNLYCRRYREQISITDLTNAHKPKSVCIRYTLDFYRNNGFCESNIFRNYEDIKALFDYLETLDFETYNSTFSGYKQKDITLNICDEEIKIYVNKSESDAKRHFNPLTYKEYYKPLKQEPKKWTIPMALRAIVNKQYKYLKCKGVYTDDYAGDAASNYRQGELDNLSFFKKVFSSPSGWRVYKDNYYNNTNEKCIINVNCHSFDTNEFEFKLS